MATLNVGSMAARLGLDPSEFLDKMKGVQGFNGFVSSQMAREWKQSSREGAESLRLLDDALGIRLPRSMSRLVTNEFPALAKGLQSILGVGAVGVLAEAGFEFAEKIAHQIDKAKKAQQEFDDAIRHTQEVLGDLGASHARTMKEIELRTAELARKPGAKQASVDFKIDTAALEEAKKQIGEVTAAMEKEAKAASDAGKWTTQFWLATGYVVENFFSSSGREADAAQTKFKTFEAALNSIMQAHAADPLQGLRESLKKANDELSTTGADIARKMAALQAAEAIANLPGHGRIGGQLKSQTGVNEEALATEQRYFETVKRDTEELGHALEEAMGKRGNEHLDVGQRRAEQIRTEVEAVRRLGETSTAAASAAGLLATATEKGTAAGILSAAKAEAQKKIFDFMAEADSKLVNGTNEKISKTKEFRAMLEATIPTIQAAALAEQTFKAFAEYNRGIDEFNTHLKEHTAALDEEAAGHSKIASEQAKELAGLIPLEEKLRALKELAGTAPAIGPPTVNQANVATATAELQVATGAARIANAKTQAGAFQEELHKLADEMKSLASAEISPWAKIDVQVAEAIERIRGLGQSEKEVAEQANQIRQALTGIQNVKIAGEFEKLAEKIKESQTEIAGFASASPFAKWDAEAQKLGREFGLDVQQISLVKQALIELQATQNVGKAWLNVDQLNSAGARMQELRQQMEALRAAASSGKVQSDDGSMVAMSPQALAAVRLEMQAIQEEQNQIALKTGDIDAGILAWATDLQKVQSAGELTFQALTEASKGFEDNVSKSLFAILDGQRGREGQLKLIHDLEAMWSSYFKNLATMGLKASMDRALAPLGKAIAGGVKGSGGEGQKPTGMAAIFASAVPKQGAGSTGAAALTSAGTMLHTAATALMSAATALRASAGGVGGGTSASGAGGSFGEASALGGAIPFFAEGGDATPGSSFISGEAGAEQVDLDRSGGAHITPLGSSQASSGDTHQHFDMRGSIVTDDVLRRTEAAAAIKASEGRMLSAIPAMQREINLRRRS